MSKVKRYLHGSETGTPGTFRMLERPYGDYVKFSDYDTLRAERDELKAALADAEVECASKSLEIKQRCEEIDALQVELEEVKIQRDVLKDTKKWTELNEAVTRRRGERILELWSINRSLHKRLRDANRGNERLAKQRDELVKALERSLAAHKHDFDMMNDPDPSVPSCLCGFCQNYLEWNRTLTRIKGG